MPQAPGSPLVDESHWDDRICGRQRHILTSAKGEQEAAGAHDHEGV